MTEPKLQGGDGEPEEQAEIPALFATIHFKSDSRPNGFTPEEIAEINEGLNPPKPSPGPPRKP